MIFASIAGFDYILVLVCIAMAPRIGIIKGERGEIHDVLVFLFLQVVFLVSFTILIV